MIESSRNDVVVLFIEVNIASVLLDATSSVTSNGMAGACPNMVSMGFVEMVIAALTEDPVSTVADFCIERSYKYSL